MNKTRHALDREFVDLIRSGGAEHPYDTVGIVNYLSCYLMGLVCDLEEEGLCARSAFGFLAESLVNSLVAQFGAEEASAMLSKKMVQAIRLE